MPLTVVRAGLVLVRRRCRLQEGMNRYFVHFPKASLLVLKISQRGEALNPI